MASDLEIAAQTQEKFQFYAVALDFTLLAAAIQTAKFGAYLLQDWLELIGWFSLACAGVVGLWKIEWSSVIRVQLARRAKVESDLAEARQLKARGTREILVLDGERMQDIDERIQNHINGIALFDSHITSIERWNAAKYTIAKVAFLVGVASLMGARACSALASLFGYELLAVA